MQIRIMSSDIWKIQKVAVYMIISVVLNSSMYSCSNIHQLHKELFQTRNYTRWTAPIKSQSEPLSVNMTYDLVGISKFNAMAGEFVARALLSFSWTDTALSWNPTEYDGITSFLYPVDKLWYPPVISSSSYISSDVVCGTGTDVRITYTGSLLWLCGSEFKEMCSPDVEYFPFDIQKCNSVFTVWGYMDSQIQIVSDPNSLYSNVHDNGQWERKGVDNKSGNTYGYSSLTYTIEFQRKSLYMILFVIIPIFVLGFLNTLVFLVKPDTGEKLSYSMTVLLANALFLVIVAESLPKVSKPIPNLCIMVVANFATSVVISMLSVLNVYLYYLEPNKAKANSLVRRLSMYLQRKVKDSDTVMEASVWKEASAKIDAVCFVLCIAWITFADAVFLVFTVIGK